MSSLGIIPRVDYAIFADPGAEGKGTYLYLEWLKNWAIENNGVPIIHSLLKSTIKQDLLTVQNSTGQRFASIPAYTLSPNGDKGMLRRQCTYEYKIMVVDKEIRRLYGLKPHARFPQTEVWFGITLDEISRAKDSNQKWKTKVYPFLNMVGKFFEREMTRGDCVRWLQVNNFPVPPKSACIFCPFQGDKRLVDKKRNNPKEWQEVINIDAGIRDSSKRGIKQPIFLHSDCKPINQVNLNENQGELFDNSCGEYCAL